MIDSKKWIEETLKAYHDFLENENNINITEEREQHLKDIRWDLIKIYAVIEALEVINTTLEKMNTTLKEIKDKDPVEIYYD